MDKAKKLWYHGWLTLPAKHQKTVILKITYWKHDRKIGVTFDSHQIWTVEHRWFFSSFCHIPSSCEVLSSYLISMQATSDSVAREEMFPCSKLGQNRLGCVFTKKDHQFSRQYDGKFTVCLFVEGRGSRVSGRELRVTSRGSKNSLQLFLNVVKSKLCRILTSRLVKIQTTSKNSQKYYATKRLVTYLLSYTPNCYVRAGELRGYIFTGNAWQRYAKRNGIGSSTNTARDLYSFWALFVLYEVQIDNNIEYW